MTFNEVRDYLASIPCISRGGCGVAAYAMYLWLKKNKQLHKEFKFVLLYKTDDEDTYQNNMKVLLNEEGNAIACSHIAVFNGDQTVDCDSEIVLSNYGFIQFVTESWFMLNILANVITWNPAFDRDHINTIEHKLDIKILKI